MDVESGGQSEQFIDAWLPRGGIVSRSINQGRLPNKDLIKGHLQHTPFDEGWWCAEQGVGLPRFKISSKLHNEKFRVCCFTAFKDTGGHEGIRLQGIKGIDGSIGRVAQVLSGLPCGFVATDPLNMVFHKTFTLACTNDAVDLQVALGHVGLRFGIMSGRRGRVGITPRRQTHRWDCTNRCRSPPEDRVGCIGWPGLLRGNRKGALLRFNHLVSTDPIASANSHIITIHQDTN
jgi:hypothetical protein